MTTSRTRRRRTVRTRRARRRGRGPRRPGLGTRLLGLVTALGVGAVVVVVLAVALATNQSLAAVARSAATVVAPAAGAGQGDAAAKAAAGASGVVCPARVPVDVGGITVPAGPVAGYCQDRLVNAAHVMVAGRAMGLDARAQEIGVMTAMGESSLVNIDHGDAVGPDSRGLFQQRATGTWGTLAERMTPEVAATHFFQRLVGVPGWTTIDPSLAAHAVQINADPYHYDKYWPAAQQVVTALGS